MDRHAQVIVRPEAWSLEALELLRRAEAHDTTGGMERVSDYHDCPLICVRALDGGDLLGAYVAHWNPEARNLAIIAASGTAPGHDLTRIMLADIEDRARALGADWVSLQTRRTGLVRKLTRSGFGVHGVILRKLMKAAQ